MSQKHQSLAGKKILITRSEDQAETTANEILKYQGTPLYLPCLETECLSNNIQQSIPLLEGKPATVLFTSRNGIQCVASALDEHFRKLLNRHKIIAIGEKTSDALQQFGVSPDLLPQTASQKGLVDALKHDGIPERLIFFRAEDGSDLLSQSLNHAGCEVITIHAYRMKCPESDATAIVAKMKNQEIDAVLLGSPKTVRNYIKRIGNTEIANMPAITVISHKVAAVAENAGLSVQSIAKAASFDSMLNALADYFNEPGA